MRALVLAWVLVLGAPALALELVPGDHERTLLVGGLLRTYRVHVPPGYSGTAAVPLVLDYHGFTSSGAAQQALSGFDDLSDQRGFIVAYPDGIDNAHNGGVCCIAGIDDVGFARGLVARMAVEARIDLRRVYVTGLSNGGAMSQRLACEAADVFAAAAPMAFPISIDPPADCQPSRPIPVLTFMGLTDVLVPYDGGLFLSAQITLDHWRDANGCLGVAPDAHIESGLSYCDTYTSCAAGVAAGLCSITADSFGGAPFDGHILYLNPDYELAELAWEFMSAYRLPGPASIPTLPLWALGALGALVLGAGARRLLRSGSVRSFSA